MRLSLTLLPLLLLSSLATACATEIGGEFESTCEDGRCDLASRRGAYAVAIRDTAAGQGMTNGVLLAGIGEVETNLAHCWSEATWACKGPSSPSCGGGPVIAGSADGPCSAQQGGLGMFQFDGGTYSQTLARHGEDILTFEGNVAEVIPFLVTRAIESVPGVNTQQEAIDWMNSIPVVDGDPRFEAWLEFVSWRYNGCKGCTSQENKYRNATKKLLNEMGSSFWNATDGGTFEPSAFIGDDCSQDPDVCDYESGGESGECLDWFNSNTNSLGGFCSLRCDGFCPDQFGSAPTFCADFEGQPGMCASKPSAANNQCEDIPGSVIQVVPRFVGTSGAPETVEAVCAPPGNALECETSEGLGGECVDTNVMECGGTLHTGLCPGGSNIRCCTR